MSATTKAWINGLLLLMTLAINTMGAIGRINNMSQKKISDMYQTLITPAPFTFSIWSIIYTLLIIAIISMIVRKKDAYTREAIEAVSPLFWVSCALNSIWIVSFSYDLIGLSTIFIFLLTATLVLIIQALGKIQTQKSVLLPITFGLYAGWLTIATVVNVAAWLVKIEWNGFGISPEIWSSITLLVAIALTAFVTFKIRNSVFPLPIAWAYYGIFRSLDGFNGIYKSLPIVVLTGLVLLVILALIQLYKNKLAVIPTR
jgi:hypothetical protein